MGHAPVADPAVVAPASHFELSQSNACLRQTYPGVRIVPGSRMVSRPVSASTRIVRCCLT